MPRTLLRTFSCRARAFRNLSLEVAILSAAFLSACSQERQVLANNDVASAPVCQPALRLVTERPFSARSGPMEVHAIAVVAGCRSNLERLTPEKERELVTAVFEPFLLEKGGASSRGELNLRHELVSQINSQVAEDLVSDAFVYRLSWKESIPSIQ